MKAKQWLERQNLDSRGLLVRLADAGLDEIRTAEDERLASMVVGGMKERTASAEVHGGFSAHTYYGNQLEGTNQCPRCGKPMLSVKLGEGIPGTALYCPTDRITLDRK